MTIPSQQFCTFEDIIDINQAQFVLTGNSQGRIINDNKNT